MDESIEPDLAKATADALALPNSVDTHFHSLEMGRAGIDPASILAWCFSHGLSAALDVSVTVADVADRLLLAESHPGLAVTAGYYPSEARRFASDAGHARSMMERLESALENTRIVAVGEIGLDFLPRKPGVQAPNPPPSSEPGRDEDREYAPRREQEELFRAQVEIAAAKGLPVVVHNREADREILEVLRLRRLSRGGIMHCYSSDAQTAFKFIDLGFLISFAGNVTYRSSHVVQDAARRLPSKALLVETDAPYLTPVPLRGRKNSPAYIGYTYQFLAKLRGEPVEALVEQVRENFRRIISAA